MRDDKKFTSLIVPYRPRSSRPFTILDASSKKAYAIHIGQSRSHRKRSYREIPFLFSVSFLIFI